MKRKALLGLSAILLPVVGALAYLHCHGQIGCTVLDNRDAATLRVEGDPLPPFPPKPPYAVLRAEGDPLPPFPWGLPS